MINENAALRNYSKFVCFCTTLLIFAGGMVTSTGSGLAVPDWPLSYGSLFPPMVGGVFYEHGHRMIASFVGVLTVIQAIWLARSEKRQWVKVLGFCALGAVILQGVLGGITVLFFLPTSISVLHATLAQTFFVLTIVIAYSLSKERQAREGKNNRFNKTFIKLVMIFIGLIYVQLILGALMRHTGSGLAVPDFPTIGGYWWPPSVHDMLYNINDWRFKHGMDPVTMTQVMIHMLHRLGAFFILLGVCIIHFLGLKWYKENELVRGTLVLLDMMLMAQISLGMSVLLTIKEPIITSLHVVNGAAFLGCSFLLLLRCAPLSLKELR